MNLTKAPFMLIVLMLLGAISSVLIIKGIQARSIEGMKYGDLTDKEDCIRNYILSYRDRDPDRLAELLHEDYIMYSSKSKGELSREGELRQTKQMFEVLTIFGLDIRPGKWVPASEFRGGECEGCWETTRGYILIYSNPGKDAAIYVSRSHFRMIVAPVIESGLTRYKIRAYEDISDSTGVEAIQAPE